MVAGRSEAMLSGRIAPVGSIVPRMSLVSAMSIRLNALADCDDTERDTKD
jgi:hypothetical protein